MIKVIETNISFNENSRPIDVQSRVIEVESWEEYVEEIEAQKQINRKSIIGCSEGVSFPKGATKEYFKWDNRRLICEFYNHNKTLMLKTAYIA